MNVIHHTLAAENEAVTIVTVGSLTNIAQWLTAYPDDATKIERVIIMGGGFDAPGNIIVPGFTDDHPNTEAEWNIYVDAPAAAQVFASGLPIEVVSLDVTNTVPVTSEFAAAFKESAATPAAAFWDKVLDDNDWFIDSGEYYFWDVLAALVAIDPGLCVGDMQPVYVSSDVTDEPSEIWTDTTIPDLTSSGDARQHLAPETAGVTHIGGGDPAVKICRETVPSRAYEMFSATMNRLD